MHSSRLSNYTIVFIVILIFNYKSSRYTSIRGEYCDCRRVARKILNCSPHHANSVEKGVDTSGEIRFDDKNIRTLPARDLEALRNAEISLMLQEPLVALNPLQTIGHQIREAILIHQKISMKKAEDLMYQILS